jgi:hypothetical protein
MECKARPMWMPFYSEIYLLSSLRVSRQWITLYPTRLICFNQYCSRGNTDATHKCAREWCPHEIGTLTRDQEIDRTITKSRHLRSMPIVIACSEAWRFRRRSGSHFKCRKFIHHRQSPLQFESTSLFRFRRYQENYDSQVRKKKGRHKSERKGPLSSSELSSCIAFSDSRDNENEPALCPPVIPVGGAI